MAASFAALFRFSAALLFLQYPWRECGFAGFAAQMPEEHLCGKPPDVVLGMSDRIAQRSYSNLSI